MHTLFLALTAHPEVQKRAQEELDRVIDTARFPLLKDRESLPYISAVLQETLRWHPVVPLCMWDISAP